MVQRLVTCAEERKVEGSSPTVSSTQTPKAHCSTARAPKLRIVTASHCPQLSLPLQVENMVLTTATSPQAYEQLMTKYKTTKRENSELQRNLAAAEGLVQRLQQENEALQAAQTPASAAARRFSVARTEIDEDVDERSKNELLRVIRRTMEDKIKWEAYAERLLRSVLLGSPHLLDIRERSNVAHCCTSEARWEAFSLSLVHHVMERCPDILDLVRTPTQTDGEKLTAARMQLV